MLQTEINYIETILIILYLNVSSNLDFYFLIPESCGIVDVIKKVSFIRWVFVSVSQLFFMCHNYYINEFPCVVTLLILGSNFK